MSINKTWAISSAICLLVSVDMRVNTPRFSLGNYSHFFAQVERNKLSTLSRS
jgi:hypothetical protein